MHAPKNQQKQNSLPVLKGDLKNRVRGSTVAQISQAKNVMTIIAGAIANMVCVSVILIP